MLPKVTEDPAGKHVPLAVNVELLVKLIGEPAAGAKILTEGAIPPPKNFIGAENDPDPLLP
jgi:hypothetical protein